MADRSRGRRRKRAGARVQQSIVGIHAASLVPGRFWWKWYEQPEANISLAHDYAPAGKLADFYKTPDAPPQPFNNLAEARAS